MSTRPTWDTPFYFGAEQALFGLFHPPAKKAHIGVLLCPPLGQEQIRCHRLYRQLAQALAAEGVAVLRFDYYGTGDSAGESEALDCQRAMADIVVAADALRASGGMDQVIAFGARLGASLALAASDAARFIGVLAWDPVLDGRSHVDHLDASQHALSTDSDRFMLPRDVADTREQWLGFAISGGLRQQLAALTINWPSVPTLLIDSLPAEAERCWPGMSDAEGTTVQTLQASTPWDDRQKLEVAILSHPLIQVVGRYVGALA